MSAKQMMPTRAYHHRTALRKFLNAFLHLSLQPFNHSSCNERNRIRPRKAINTLQLIVGNKLQIPARRGISPLIATIILIAITVIGGALVYTIFLSTASSATGGVSVQLSGVTLSASNGLTLNIKNSGSNTINGNTSTISIDNGALCGIGESSTEDACTISVYINSIAPGQTETTTISGLTSGPSDTPIQPGTTYTITFVAGDTAGSTASFTYSVTATS